MNEINYQTLFAQSPILQLVLDRDFTILKASDFYLSTTNRKFKDIYGKNILEVFYKNDINSETDNTLLDSLKKVIHSKVTDKIIIDSYGITGSSNDAEQLAITHFPILDKFNNVQFIVQKLDNVTEVIQVKNQNEIEILSRSILENSPDCIKIIDKEGSIKFMNDKGLNLLEIEHFAEVQNRYWWDFWEQDDKTLIKNALAKALAKEKVHFQASAYTTKGKLKWWDVIVLPMPANNESNKIERLLTVSRDITDYKNANLKIVESEHRYKQMIYSSPFLIAILKGNNFVVEIANDAILEAWGKGKDVIGKSLLYIMPEILDQGFKNLLEDVYVTGKTFEAYEMPVSLERNGTIELLYFDFVYQAQKNIDGIINGISIIANEVTPKVIINKKIAASEQHFRQLVLQAPVAICVLKGKEYIIEIINEPMLQLWNREMADAINKPAFDVLTELKTQGLKELLDAVYETGIPFVAQELPLKLYRNGTLEHVFVKFVYEPLRNEYAEIVGIMALAIEITDLVLARKKIEESEKYFRQLADVMPSKISHADTDGNLLYSNKNWLNYTGKSFEDLKGLGYYNIIHPDELEKFSTKFLKASQTGSVLTMEMRFLNKNGEYKWHLHIVSPITDEDGKVTMFISSTTEIHEQVTQKEILESAVKQRTFELEIANKKLIYQNLEKEKSSAELGIANVELAFQNKEKENRSAELLIANKDLHSFTYVASHDLQEPLRKIQFFADRIIETEHHNLTDIGKDYFKRMHKAAIRMQQLIEDLLAFSRVNIIDRKFVATDLKEIIETVKAELKESIENKHVIIEIQNMCKIKVIVFQFRQLLHNLLGNSIKFALPGIAPNIVINTRIEKGSMLDNEQLIPEKKYCHITVKDNGIGFEPEYSKRIFEVFQKLHSKEIYKGTGIGLAIVKKIVDNHSGIITAKSVLGEGATFDIYLPF